MIVIVKLGGAAITNKKGICELTSEKNITRLLDQVAEAYVHLKTAGHQLILIHGAGSFGHPQAVQYQLKTGWSADRLPSPDYLKGYAHIRTCLQSLVHTVSSDLERRQVPVLAMSPTDYIITDDGEETSTDRFGPMIDRIQQYLRLGFVPLLHGDAVLDRVRGCTVLSGDVIMYQLAKAMVNVSRCVFITDVAGIYQHDPKVVYPQQGENPLVPHIVVSQHSDQPITSASTVADVTGGMQGKIRWAKRIVSEVGAKRKMEVVICRWGTEEALAMMSLEQDRRAGAKMTVFTL
ncbi:Isopentenyl phosphate kinase [Choanephora cucurbitarum]|uniref:Isopentenyl phosphate kinase n=1 Tax=Choanephora cucurbitarum TaxID=101091 RepID=A0A1C7NHN7_9FUNG|nr:Isopentenyl phosphate kinase [Choanephora cucurbitarum]